MRITQQKLKKVDVVLVCLAVLFALSLVLRFFGSPGNIPKLTLPGIGTSPYGTLVLVLSSNCSYCAQGAPFYEFLTEHARGLGVRVVALMPESVPEAKQWLEGNSVRADEIAQVNPRSIGVRRVPTVVLQDPVG
jgi:thiol-disulfide isomerase/thioredoxin